VAKKTVDNRDDAPELTAELLAKAKPARDALPPAVQAAFKRPPGRPRVDAPRQVVSIRMDPKVLDYFKRTGPGWQSRMHDVLAREAAKG